MFGSINGDINKLRWLEGKRTITFYDHYLPDNFPNKENECCRKHWEFEEVLYSPLK